MLSHNAMSTTKPTMSLITCVVFISHFPFRNFWALLKASKNSTSILHQTKTPFSWRGLCIIPPDAIGAGSESTEELMNSSVELFCYCWGAKQTYAVVLPAASNFRGFKYNAHYADLHLQILLLCPFYSVSGSCPSYSFFCVSSVISALICLTFLVVVYLYSQKSMWTISSIDAVQCAY